MTIKCYNGQVSNRSYFVESPRLMKPIAFRKMIFLLVTQSISPSNLRCSKFMTTLSSTFQQCKFLITFQQVNSCFQLMIIINIQGDRVFDNQFSHYKYWSLMMGPIIKSGMIIKSILHDYYVNSLISVTNFSRKNLKSVWSY